MNKTKKKAKTMIRKCKDLISRNSKSEERPTGRNIFTNKEWARFQGRDRRGEPIYRRLYLNAIERRVYENRLKDEWRKEECQKRQKN